MFNPAYFINSRSDGFAVLEIPPLEDSPGNAPRRFVPLRRTELHGDIVGPLADLRLDQVFGFSAAEYAAPVAAIYRFPLPGDAAVTGVTVHFGAVRIVATLATRAEAAARYAEAQAHGKQAALTLREAPDVFTLLVTGIRPDEEVRVTTHFVQMARSRGLDWLLRIPLTTAPRYVREDDRTTAHAKGQPLQIARDPGHRFRLNVKIHGSHAVHSPTHALTIAPEPEAQRAQHSEKTEDSDVRVTLRDDEVTPDRDCVLVWRLAQAAAAPTLEVRCHVEDTEDAIYLLAGVSPPAAPPDEAQAREVILLVDHSGSMHGPKWQAADWAIERFLADMGAGDYFALACFHNTPHWQQRTVEPVRPETVARAVDWLQQQRDSGGTNLGVALEQALALPPAPDVATRHVLIVTDAAVSDAGRILRLADASVAGAVKRRVSVLCIDAAPNDALVNEMVRRSGGLARFLTSDPTQEDITTALDEVLHAWSRPVHTGLRLLVDRATISGLRTAAAPEGWAALDLGDLPGDQAIWSAARTVKGDDARLEVRLVDQQNHILAAQVVDLRQTEAHPALRALYGAPRINALEYLAHGRHSGDEIRDRLLQLGYDLAAIDPQSSPAAESQRHESPIYAENQAEAAADALHDLIAQEALRYGLPSSATAFIALRHDADAPTAITTPVANALPHGWRPPTPGPAQLALPAMDVNGAVMEANVYGRQAPGSATPSLNQAQPQPALMPQPLTGGMRSRPDAPTFHTLFSGGPQLVDGQAILYAGEPAPGESIVISALRVEGKPGPTDATWREDVLLLLYVDDMTLACARIRLYDLLRLGDRPLNLRKPAGAPMRIVLVDPRREADYTAVELSVVLAWH